MSDTMHQARGEAADAARSVGSTAKERATDVASTTGDEVRAVAHDARAQAEQVVRRSREQLRAQASDQTSRLAGTMRDVGDQIRAMARGEAPSDDSPVAGIANQIADTVSRTASRLDEGGIDGAVADVKRYARNHPGMFLAGALAAGFVVGRVVKSVDTRAIAEAAKGGHDEPDMISGPGYQTGIGAAPAVADPAALGAATPPPTYTPTTPTTPYSTADVDLTSELP